MNISIVLIYTLICGFSAAMAARKDGEFWNNFFLAFALTPFVLIRKVIRNNAS
jgi:ABC-type spermidine/putrescine transport system permease subunit I